MNHMCKSLPFVVHKKINRRFLKSIYTIHFQICNPISMNQKEAYGSLSPVLPVLSQHAYSSCGDRKKKLPLQHSAWQFTVLSLGRSTKLSRCRDIPRPIRRALVEVAFFLRQRQLQRPCLAIFFSIARSLPPLGCALPLLHAFTCFPVSVPVLLEAWQRRLPSPAAFLRRCRGLPTTQF